MKKFDVIIFGASGHLGRRTVEQAVNILKNITWAVAGRNKEKLQYMLEEVTQHTHTDISNSSIIIADTNNKKSIIKMIEQCQVLVNCFGPTQLDGEIIISNCIQLGTHYVDVCNDPYFNELMQFKYHEKAQENNVYIISANGFQSFPVDIGINYLQKHFNGVINHIDAYVKYSFRNSIIPRGPIVTNTAWHSVILLAANIGFLSEIRKQLRQKCFPSLTPRQSIKSIFCTSPNESSSTIVRFPLIDQQTVQRSQYYFYIEKKQRPIQFYKYLVVPSLLMAFLFVVWIFIVTLMSQFNKTRYFILKYSGWFSVGLVSSCKLDDTFMDNINYKITLNAVGWSSSITQSIDELNEDKLFDQRMNLEISGFSPVYGVSSICILLSAITILEELHNLPNTGGVYSPGFAFVQTSLFEKLAKFNNHLSFRIID